MWEYRIEALRMTRSRATGELHLVYLPATAWCSIRILGQEGWELVRLLGADDPTDEHIGVFKRPVRGPA